MSIYLGIHRIALFWYEQFRQIYLAERICICICIWIDVFVFVFESKLNKIFVFVFVFEKSKFLYLYLYLYLIKRIWPQPCLQGRNKLIVLSMSANEFTEVPHTISQGIVC